jgi:hypothetical protein
LIESGVNVDLKILLNELNDNPRAIEEIFEFASRLQVRMLYFRLTVLNGKSHVPKNLELIELLKEKYNLPTRVNVSRTFTRNYSRCHMMFFLPIFTATGDIYVCCENRGNDRFKIGSWLDPDWQHTVWCAEKHMELYNSVNTHLCPPCRPNIHNIEIQNELDNPELKDRLFL